MLPKENEISAAKKENGRMVTLTFAKKIPAKPGQFLMVWLPGVGEKPMGFSSLSPSAITVNKIGPFSNALAAKRKGGRAWLRGPYGNGFRLKGKRLLVIGGGCGAAPLRPLVSEAKKKKIAVTAVIGARNKDCLLPLKGDRTIVCTDDGSAGRKGFVTEAMEELLAPGPAGKQEKFDLVCACGPEKMLYRVAAIAKKHKVPSQLLVERFMKCATGVCGQCALGKKLVCRDGPVFSGDELLKEEEFGKWQRDSSGRKIML